MSLKQIQQRPIVVLLLFGNVEHGLVIQPFFHESFPEFIARFAKISSVKISSLKVCLHYTHLYAVK